MVFFALRALHSPAAYKRTFVPFSSHRICRFYDSCGFKYENHHPAGAQQKILEPNCGVFI